LGQGHSRRRCIGGRPAGVVSVFRRLFFGFEPVEGDGVAEGFELALQAASAVLDRVALALPFRAEIAVRDLVADDVVVGHEQVVADRADRLLLAVAASELGVVRGVANTRRMNA